MPGLGLLAATAVVASMGNAQAFTDAREFSAWVGLVPRQSCTSGRVRQWASANVGTYICERC
ncbi:transposase [Comamonas thiooxydans]|uniref:transposase n=1 Tax=Comamonas thiooxydans TaxID=363952 RepID=UPI0035A71631